MADKTVNARMRQWSIRLDLAFGAFWIVMAVAALLAPMQDLWPALPCVGWAALGGYIVGQAVQERRDELPAGRPVAHTEKGERR